MSKDAIGGLFGWETGDSNATCVWALGVPVDDGNVVAPGARHGPTALRRASRSMRSNIQGRDLGNLPIDHLQDLRDTLRAVGAVVDQTLEAAATPLIIGGDHSISYAPIRSCQRRSEITLVWFDAHLDFCQLTHDDGHSHKQVLRRVASLPNVAEIVHIGYRGYTVDDERYVSEKIRVIPSCEAAESRFHLKEMVKPDRPCYISIDVDVLDPRFAPGTSTPVPGGLTPERLLRLVLSIGQVSPLIGIDLMEVNPTFDRANRTSKVCADLLGRALPTLMSRRVAGAPKLA